MYLWYSVAIGGLLLLVILGQHQPEEKTIQEAQKSPENRLVQINATITRILPGAKRTILTLKDSSATTTVMLRKKTPLESKQQVSLKVKIIREKEWEVKKIVPCSQPCVP